MWLTCEHAMCMSKMIQLRNVPDSLHRRLKARAAMEGMSLSEYLIAEVKRAAERPSLGELRQRLAQRTPVRPRIPPAQAVREAREERSR
jgi:plasmid stability protein